jgi:uncharacterized cysteine cluster protein YcgN (CxxCxxCC family)
MFPSYQEPFWKVKSLDQMSREEWESLCDGCGICCLLKVEDEAKGRIVLTSISCHFLDTETCRCMVYADRRLVNPDCEDLDPGRIKEFSWLPCSCAYRCLAEGRDLAWWHHLVSGSLETVHAAGISIREKVVSARHVHPHDIMRHNR